MDLDEYFKNRKEPISYYDTMQVCEKNGHKITDWYDTSPEVRQDHCQMCGSKTIIKCPSCQTKIRGYRHFKSIVGGTGPEAPLYCHQCGKAYPWKENLVKTRKAIQKTGLNRWNYINPAWLIWNVLIIAWNHKIISSVIVALVSGYLLWSFGWK